MWAMTSTTKALHEMRHGGRLARNRRNLTQWMQRDRIPAAPLGRPATAR
jgi:hypothetical protein